MYDKLFPRKNRAPFRPSCSAETVAYTADYPHSGGVYIVVRGFYRLQLQGAVYTDEPVFYDRAGNDSAGLG